MTQPRDEPVYVVREGAVATITLNRPTALNAINQELAAALLASVASVEEQADVRAVVLKGAGRAFCVGGDIAMMRSEDRERAVAASIGHFHEAVRRLAELPLVTVAMLHGAVAGAGLSLALACDFAVAASGTQFAFAYPQVGATPDGGITWTLPRLVGLRRAKEIALLTERFDADEAERLGLVNRVVPAEALDAETRALAGRLAAGPTAAFGRIKKLLHQSACAELSGQLEAERNAFEGTLGTADLTEGLQAFVEKRSPKFKGC